MWNRENDYLKKGPTAFQWGTYFNPPLKTLIETSPTAKDNKILRRTDAKELIVENGRVTGVKAVMYDGTPVTAHAKKGVVLSTGGYAANVAKVMETNDYWKPGKITARTQTTNRSTMQGDGIIMGEKVGAATTGLDFAQLMPISWIDNGQLAFGGGNYSVYINPTTAMVHRVYSLKSQTARYRSRDRILTEHREQKLGKPMYRGDSMSVQLTSLMLCSKNLDLSAMLML